VLLVLSVLIIFSNILLVTLIKTNWKKYFLFLWIFVFDAYAYQIFSNLLDKRILSNGVINIRWLKLRDYQQNLHLYI
jgi:hypothetical protein